MTLVILEMAEQMEEKLNRLIFMGHNIQVTQKTLAPYRKGFSGIKF